MGAMARETAAIVFITAAASPLPTPSTAARCMKCVWMTTLRPAPIAWGIRLKAIIRPLRATPHMTKAAHMERWQVVTCSLGPRRSMKKPVHEEPIQSAVPYAEANLPNCLGPQPSRSFMRRIATSLMCEYAVHSPMPQISDVMQHSGSRIRILNAPLALLVGYTAGVLRAEGISPLVEASGPLSPPSLPVSESMLVCLDREPVLPSRSGFFKSDEDFLEGIWSSGSAGGHGNGLEKAVSGSRR
mmetsp:Transcript_40232/g.87957  ORF Transcript_40232/g.87957 Transcript_40232/m.87957 type:complete len:243 (-) Transcript_40232:474-1202(-)